MENLWSLKASEISKLYLSNEISLDEIINSVEERFNQVNPKINAIPESTFEYARKQAKLLDENKKSNKPLGCLAGVPVTVKINTDQTGFASTNGLRLNKSLIAHKNSTVVDNLEKAGALIVGRTNTPAFSIRWFTNNSLHGHTFNPHNKNITPGGSSGGAASATASGIGCIGHGTDIAGSIRYPAYACGIHGIRPSLGRVPMINYSAPDRYIGGQIMAVSGPLARSIKDLELGYDAMRQSNYDDPWWTPLSNDLPTLNKKIALLSEIKGMKISKEVKSNLLDVAKKLEKEGWIIDEVEGPNFEEIAHYQAVLWLAEFRRSSGKAIFDEKDEEAMFVFDQMSKKCPDTSIEKFMDSLQQRATLGRKWAHFFDEYPLILCPISGDLPFEDLKDTKSEKDFDEVFSSMLPQIAPPYLGLPGLCFSNHINKKKIPIGVQFISRKFREDQLFKVAYDLEQHFPEIKTITPDY